MSVIVNPEGYDLNPGAVFSAPISASRVGSTHFILPPAGYVIWADQPFAMFLTDATHDPPAVPSTLTNWPGSLVGAGQILEFIFNNQDPVLVGVTLLIPTGIRVFQLQGTAGTFYVSTFASRG